MTLSNISIAAYIVGKLRGNITDPNSANRTSSYGQWIYGDRPKITKLLNNKNNFPRISVESISNSTISEMGMSDESQEESTSLKINVWTMTDLICDITKTDAESHTFATGTDIYGLSILPASVITLVTGTLSTTPHTFIKGTDYQLIDNDSDGFYDSIEWLGEDEPDDGTDFKASYKRTAAGPELVRYLAQKVGQYLRTWRDWDEKIVWSYKKTGSNPIEFDSGINIYRYELTVSFQGIDLGDSI